MMFRKIFTLILGTAVVFGLGLGVAQADDFPEKPITLILPLGAGGSHDRNARVFTSTIPTYLGNAIIVKLMPGASGQTGTAAAASAKPDGYTLLFTHNYFDQLQQHVVKLPYDTNKDFISVAQLNSNDASFIVNSDSPFNSLADLVDHAKANPGALKFAHSGVWGAVHVPAVRFFKEAGIDVTLVPYKGGGPAMAGFLAGDADFTMQFPSTILGQGDKVRVLASGASGLFEGVPSFGELGYTEDIGSMRRIIMAPRGIPADRLSKIQDALVAMQDDKTYKRLIKAIGENLNFVNGPEYEALRPGQSKAFKELIESLAQ
ncbi:MAG: tripartite tricarboxylate transporter substrate binding protein [Rhodobacteraceae bacterium]|nr:tripartite tricarboxylate transporter substrate binding protein [Paracoccaceae bacterium]